MIVPDEQPGFRITIASDGLWDAVTVKQAAQCAGRLATAAAAAALCKRAQKQKDNRDDITVLVVDALADPSHKDPFQDKPPWKVKFKVKWPLRGAPGKEPTLDDPVEVPPPERARAVAPGGARARGGGGGGGGGGGAGTRGGRGGGAAGRRSLRAALFTKRSRRFERSFERRGGWEEVPRAARAVRGGHAARLAGEEEEEAAAAVERGTREARVRGGEPRRKARTAPGRTRRFQEKPERARRRERRREGGGVARAASATAAAAAGMRNLSVSGAAAPPAPRPSAEQAPATPAKKEKRKGKRERAGRRAPPPSAAASAGSISSHEYIVATSAGPDVPVASAVSGEAAALVAAQMARLAELQRQQMELQAQMGMAPGFAPPQTLGARHVSGHFQPAQFRGNPGGHPEEMRRPSDHTQSVYAQAPGFAPGPHPGWPPGGPPPFHHPPAPDFDPRRPFQGDASVSGAVAGDAPALRSTPAPPAPPPRRTPPRRPSRSARASASARRRGPGAKPRRRTRETRSLLASSSYLRFVHFNSHSCKTSSDTTRGTLAR